MSVDQTDFPVTLFLTNDREPQGTSSPFVNLLPAVLDRRDEQTSFHLTLLTLQLLSGSCFVPIRFLEAEDLNEA